MMKGKSHETSENQCLGCGKHDALFECTGCLDASFCSQDCQRKTWSTHRFECLPCSICGKRVPGTQVRRDCACVNGGYSHIACLVKEAVEDSGGKEWSFSSTQFEKCKICGEPYTGDTKEALLKEQKARIEKAEETLHNLLAVCQDVGNEIGHLHHWDLLNYGSMAERAIDIGRELHGEKDSNSNEDMFWAFYCLARVFLNVNKGLLDVNEEEKSEENFRLALVEAEKHKTGGRMNRLKLATMWLADTYMNRKKYSEALPLLEQVYDKYYQFLGSENRFRTTKWLAECYYFTSSWKQARNMVKVAREQCEVLHGGDDRRTLDLIEMHAKIINKSHNAAETRGVKDIPDGTTVEIASVSNGCFAIALMSDSSDDDADRFTVSPEQVIMVPDSDVVLHSLKGAKHLNGKLGIIETFNVELGRYVVIVEGISKAVNVKPQNLLPAYMGCEKEGMMKLAIELSQEEEEY